VQKSAGLRDRCVLRELQSLTLGPIINSGSSKTEIVRGRSLTNYGE